MRALQTHDIFAAGRVIKEIGIRDEIKAVAMKSNSLADVYENGFDLIFGVIEKCTTENAEDKLLKFFADIFEEDVESLRTSDPIEFMDKLMQVAEPDKWKAFFTRVAAMIP